MRENLCSFGTKLTTTQPFIPKRVIITEKSQDNPLAQRKLERIRLLNPEVLVEMYDGEKIPEPNILNNKEFYEYYAETVVLASRSSNFIEVFAAPGAIVEEMNTMCKILQHCSSRCQFCYLQVAGQDPARWQKLWTNLDDLGHQCDVEMLFNKTALTLWSTISFYKEEPFSKVPEGFKELVDQMRNMFLRKEDPIATDEAAKRYLETALADILLVTLGLDHNPKRFDEVKANVRSYYNENAKLKLWINIGEYSDIVAVDHITGYLELFMKMLEAKPELRLEFSTKSANIENVLKYPAFKRLCVGMNFNTEHMIDRYEGGTASLEERFAAVKLLLEKGDVLVKFTIEPIIKYDGYEEDYRRLARRIAEELPLADPRIVSVKVGGPRFRKQLAQEIQKNHPGIDLFTPYQGLVEPEEKDQRMRYPVEERLAIYRILMAELKDAGGRLVLGCEFPRVWEELGLYWKAHIGRHVHQYSGTT